MQIHINYMLNIGVKKVQISKCARLAQCTLSIILLAQQNTLNLDLDCSLAKLVYGTIFRLPGEINHSATAKAPMNSEPEI